ncbi:MAG: hypothetical protein IPK77_01450 [Cellvibrio sp.]|nr:hypothetical protein [Cellvibrio sp.]
MYQLSINNRTVLPLYKLDTLRISVCAARNFPVLPAVGINLDNKGMAILFPFSRLAICASVTQHCPRTKRAKLGLLPC